MLTDSDLAGCRSTAGAALPDTAIIQNATSVSDGGGGGSVTWTSAGTLACRIAPMASAEKETGDRISAYTERIVTLPYNAPVTTNSRLLIGGGTLNISAVSERGAWPLTTRVECKKEV